MHRMKQSKNDPDKGSMKNCRPGCLIGAAVFEIIDYSIVISFGCSTAFGTSFGT